MGRLGGERRMNGDMKHSRKIIDLLTEASRNPFSVCGSSVYGSYEPGAIKPDEKSDIDGLTLIERSSDLECLAGLVTPLSLGKELFDNGNVDILAVRGDYEGRKILVHCIRRDSYLRMAKGSMDFILVHKPLRGKNIRSFYEYTDYGFSDELKRHSRITPLQEGHLIVYPCQSNKFYLSVFQDQICTQSEFKDDSTLEEGRLITTELLVRAARADHADPLSVFRARSGYWSSKFREEMRRRVEVSK